jgi:1-acyl-sn-glycerol-3-phosphate acyltransferase
LHSIGKINQAGIRAMLDVLRSCFTIPLIYFYTLVMGSLSLLLSFVDRDGSQQHWCAVTWCRMIAATAGAKLQVSGLENVPPNQACVFIANHQSYLDIPALFSSLPVQFRILAKRVLFYVPFMGWFLWRAGHIPIDRDNARAALANVNRAVDKLKSGYSIVVFPEGTRSEEGKLQEFKSGGFKIAVKAGVPIVPVTIIGTHRVLRKDSLVFHPGQVKIIVDAPIDSQQYNSRTLLELVARTQSCIAANLAAAESRNWTMQRQPQSIGSGEAG